MFSIQPGSDLFSPVHRHSLHPAGAVQGDMKPSLKREDILPGALVIDVR
jgi:hypothetical protein